MSQMDDVDFVLTVFLDPDYSAVFSYTPFKGLQFKDSTTGLEYLVSTPTTLSGLADDLRIATKMYNFMKPEVTNAETTT